MPRGYSDSGSGGASIDVTLLSDLLTSGTWTDPGGNHLSGTPSYNGATGVWTVALLGGVGTSASDPFDGAHLIGAPLTLADGSAFTGAHLWSVLFHLLEITAPDLSSDIAVDVGLCNEGADSGTIDAMFIGLAYTGGSRAGRRARVGNGANTGANGSAHANIRAHASTILKCGTGATAQCVSMGTVRMLDGSAGPMAQAAPSTDLTTNWGDVAPRPVISVRRTSTTDTTTRTVEFRVRRGLVTSHTHPTNS